MARLRPVLAPYFDQGSTLSTPLGPFPRLKPRVPRSTPYSIPVIEHYRAAFNRARLARQRDQAKLAPASRLGQSTLAESPRSRPCAVMSATISVGLFFFTFRPPTK